MTENSICKLFNIRYPIVSGGMVWCSGWRLAAAVSNAGGLGLIGAGSMYPDVLAEHIKKCQEATQLPFGVNVPLLYPEIDKLMDIIVSSGVKIVFTSAGNPALWTSFLKEKGITVVHVVSNTKFAKKAADAGVDAIVAEGFEAGGHNGREETTTMVLIPHVREVVDLPLIAAGGIGSGQAMLAAMALGADGVQLGSLFAATEESSAHPAFKQCILDAGEGDTMLMMKKTVGVRLLKNPFFDAIKEAEARGADADELKTILGRGRAKSGMFEGDLENGELEIGQVASMIDTISPVADVMKKLVNDYQMALSRLKSL
ncbi:MAG: nitronate monooxygenase [Bacteroidales bacterium]|jgi:enoyl-[acyl-carrier protein] reductase II|nr:nitronate monooxygenase [Bacteroidales bacterium]